MTKQEVVFLILQDVRLGELSEYGATLKLQDLGVVIKVERELPEKVADELDDLFDIWALRPDYARQLVTEALNKAGFYPVESLLKEVKDEYRDNTTG